MLYEDSVKPPKSWTSLRMNEGLGKRRKLEEMELIGILVNSARPGIIGELLLNYSKIISFWVF